MIRGSLIFASAISLVLFVATVVVGLRSYRHDVTLCYDTEASLPRRTKVLMCAGGTLQWLELQTQYGGSTSAAPTFAIPLWLVATAFGAGGAYAVREAALGVERLRRT